MTTVENGDSKCETQKAKSADSYRLIAVELNCTGRRLHDELMQMSGYASEKETFDQYVMPHGAPSYSSIQRHNLDVINPAGLRYRLLKNYRTGKVQKTKSEFATLIDFLEWLKKVKGDDDGVVLIYHETAKFVPHMMVNLVKRYAADDRFYGLVKGFVNGFDIAKDKADKEIRSHSLVFLNRVVLGKDGAKYLDSAKHRAKAIYDLVAKFYDGEVKYDNVVEYTTAAKSERIELDNLFELIARQNNLRPIFEPNFRRYNTRSRAVALRKKVVDAGLDYDVLKNSFEKGQKDEIVKVLNEKIENDERAINELVELVVVHFAIETGKKVKKEGITEPPSGDIKVEKVEEVEEPKAPRRGSGKRHSKRGKKGSIGGGEDKAKRESGDAPEKEVVAVGGKEEK